MGFEINLNKVLGQFIDTKNNKTVKPDNNYTIPMTGNTSEAKNVSWKEAMGLNLHTSKPVEKNEAVFSDDDLAAFVNTYATNISKETANRVEAHNKNGVFANDMIAGTGAKAELLDVAGALFRDADYTRELA